MTMLGNRATCNTAKAGMMVHALLPALFKPARHPAKRTRVTQPEDFNVLLGDVARAQDRGAFARLFSHFAPRIKAYLMRLGAPASQAEDLAQEALLTVWRKAVLFDPARASASTWIFTIARNLRIDALRRERRPLLDSGDPSLAPPAEQAADDGMEIQESEAALRNALETLSPDHREIVQLSYFSDKPHSQIAAELGIPLGTVKSRLRLAMARLRAVLGDET